MGQIILSGLGAEEFLESIRQIVRAEIEAQPQQQGAKRFIDIEEATSFLSLSRSTIYRLTSTKEIPHIKRGGKILFDVDGLTAWLLSSQKKTKEEIGV